MELCICSTASDAAMVRPRVIAGSIFSGRASSCDRSVSKPRTLTLKVTAKKDGDTAIGESERKMTSLNRSDGKTYISWTTTGTDRDIGVYRDGRTLSEAPWIRTWTLMAC